MYVAAADMDATYDAYVAAEADSFNNTEKLRMMLVRLIMLILMMENIVLVSRDLRQAPMSILADIQRC